MSDQVHVVLNPQVSLDTLNKIVNHFLGEAVNPVEQEAKPKKKRVKSESGDAPKKKKSVEPEETPFVVGTPLAKPKKKRSEPAEGDAPKKKHSEAAEGDAPKKKRTKKEPVEGEAPKKKRSEPVEGDAPKKKRVKKDETSEKKPAEAAALPTPELLGSGKPLGTSFLIQFDGATKENPGPSGAAWTMSEKGNEVALGIHYMGEKNTNNEAEYCAVNKALEFALSVSSKMKSLKIQGDSNLVVKQVNGDWKCKAANLIPYMKAARSSMDILKKAGVSVNLEWIPREKNTRADGLANVSVANKQTIKLSAF